MRKMQNKILKQKKDHNLYTETEQQRKENTRLNGDYLDTSSCFFRHVSEKWSMKLRFIHFIAAGRGKDLLANSSQDTQIPQSHTFSAWKWFEQANQHLPDPSLPSC